MISLVDKITAKSAVVGVIGVGYVGLSLARVFWEAGFGVVGFDDGVERIESLGHGASCIKSVDPEKVATAIRDGTSSATS